MNYKYVTYQGILFASNDVSVICYLVVMDSFHIVVCSICLLVHKGVKLSLSGLSQEYLKVKCFNWRITRCVLWGASF